MKIAIGTTLSKPVETQVECDAYSVIAAAVNAHNAACTVGDALWVIEDGATCYTVAEGDTVPPPEPAAPTAEEALAALQSAQTDTDSLMVDQEYRLTLLELGITD